MTTDERQPRKPIIAKLVTVPDARRVDHAGRVIESSEFTVREFSERKPDAPPKRDDAA